MADLSWYQDLWRVAVVPILRSSRGARNEDIYWDLSTAQPVR